MDDYDYTRKIERRLFTMTLLHYKHLFLVVTGCVLAVAYLIAGVTNTCENIAAAPDYAREVAFLVFLVALGNSIGSLIAVAKTNRDK